MAAQIKTLPRSYYCLQAAIPDLSCPTSNLSRKRLAGLILSLSPGPHAIALIGVRGVGKSVLASQVLEELKGASNLVISFNVWSDSGDSLARSVLWRMFNSIKSEGGFESAGTAQDVVWRFEGRLKDEEESGSLRVAQLIALFLVPLFLLALKESIWKHWLENLVISSALLIAWLTFVALVIVYVTQDWKWLSLPIRAFSGKPARVRRLTNPDPSEIDIVESIANLLLLVRDQYERVVLVIDNSDRDAEKIPLIWSLLDSIASSTRRELKKLVVLVPLDPQPLGLTEVPNSEQTNEDGSRAWSKVDDQLSKVFSATVKVPRPRIEDGRILFESLFDQLFGTNVDKLERSATFEVFRYREGWSTEPLPRKIATFLNNIAIRSRLALNSIPLQYFAYYELIGGGPEQVESTLIQNANKLDPGLDRHVGDRFLQRLSAVHFLCSVDESESTLYRTLGKKVASGGPLPGEGPHLTSELFWKEAVEAIRRVPASESQHVAEKALGWLATAKGIRDNEFARELVENICESAWSDRRGATDNLSLLQSSVGFVKEACSAEVGLRVLRYACKADYAHPREEVKAANHRFKQVAHVLGLLAEECLQLSSPEAVSDASRLDCSLVQCVALHAHFPEDTSWFAPVRQYSSKEVGSVEMQAPKELKSFQTKFPTNFI